MRHLPGVCADRPAPAHHFCEGRLLKVTYDHHTDTLSLIFQEGSAIAESDEQKPGVILDFDAAGNLVSLEIMDASTRVAEPARMEFSTQP